MSNPTLVDDYRWWRTTGKISTRHSRCTSVTTVRTRNYTEPKVNISQQCLLYSTPHLQFKKKVIEKRKDLGRTGIRRRNGTLANKENGSKKWYWTSCFNPRVKRFISVSARLCAVVQVRDLILSDACSPTPSYKMFIWTHAMNPELLRRLVWARSWCRRPAPIIICGLVHVRQPTMRPQTTTGWLHLWPSPLQTSQGPFPRGNVFIIQRNFS